MTLAGVLERWQRREIGTAEALRLAGFSRDHELFHALRVHGVRVRWTAVVEDPAIMSGVTTVATTRILAETILSYLRKGHGENEIRTDYPTLPADGIAAVRAWVAAVHGPGWRNG